MAVPGCTKYYHQTVACMHCIYTLLQKNKNQKTWDNRQSSQQTHTNLPPRPHNIQHINSLHQLKHTGLTSNSFLLPQEQHGAQCHPQTRHPGSPSAHRNQNFNQKSPDQDTPVTHTPQLQCRQENLHVWSRERSERGRRL